VLPFASIFCPHGHLLKFFIHSIVLGLMKLANINFINKVIILSTSQGMISGLCRGHEHSIISVSSISSKAVDIYEISEMGML